MKHRKIVFFDIDHTLYDPYKRAIPKSTYKALKALSLKQDILLVIATGRALYMLSIIEAVLPFIDAFITINGQIITTREKKTIHDAPMSDKEIDSIRKVFERHDLTFGYIGKHTQAVNRFDDDTLENFDSVEMPHPTCDPDFPIHHAVYQMWAFANDATADQVNKDLPKFKLAPWLSDGFDIVLDNQTKKDGIIKTLEYFKVPLASTYAFGDGDNDIDMLRFIPNSVAMGNSKHHVKQSAKYVTEPFNQHGIANALIRLNLLSEDELI